MTNTLEIKAIGNVVEVRVTGKLTTESYETFIPAVESQIQEHGKLRMLFSMHDFHGRNAGALWEDTKFAFHHAKDIERLALVGEKKWQKGMAVFCRPFTKAEVRYFDQKDLDEARRWIRS